MIGNFTQVLFGLLLSQPPHEPALLIGTSKDLSTSVQLIETADSVLFEFTGPESVAPSVSIDVNRNGRVDRNVDFQVSLDAKGEPCLQLLLHEGASSTCKQLGKKASVTRKSLNQGMITTVTFPKYEVSGDGFGFGFAIDLWSVTGDYGTLLASGDYRFGGHLSLVKEGPNFKGAKDYDLPPQMLPAVHRYQGCLSRSLRALEPIDKTKVAEMRAIPAACAAERSASLSEGTSALTESGLPKDEAAKAMLSVLDEMDATIERMVEIAKNPGRQQTAPF